MPSLNAEFKATHFRRLLLDWFRKNKRELPWRQSNNWYSTFLSEFLLQQTQVEQALPYYKKFIENYPDIPTLAKASEHDVLNLWAGLGYYSRARNLLKSAKILTQKFGGKFPIDFKQALSLPGIGNYTASAILSIAYSQPYSVVDGNVKRVISRVYSITDDIRLDITHKLIQNICNTLISKKHPGDFNEGLMELGATLCKPKNPFCPQCPINKFCLAYERGEVSNIPFKSPSVPKSI